MKSLKIGADISMKKVISIVFIVSLLMSVFAFSACSKKVEDVQQSSWFSANTFDLDINVEGEISGIFPYAYCYLNDKIYVSAVVAGKFPEDDFQTSKGFIIEADSNNGQTTEVVNYKDILQEVLPATVGADNTEAIMQVPNFRFTHLRLSQAIAKTKMRLGNL